MYLASIADWDLKRQEHSARPIRVICELSRFGLIEDVDNDPTHGSQFQSYGHGQGLQTMNSSSWETDQTPSSWERVAGRSPNRNREPFRCREDFIRN